MANTDGLIPHQFKPGQSGNPNGRPKGTLNFKTILRKILDDDISFDDPISKHPVVIQVREAIVLRLVEKALGGNLDAINDVRTWAEGPLKQSIEIEDKATVRTLAERSSDIISKISALAGEAKGETYAKKGNPPTIKASKNRGNRA